MTTDRRGLLPSNTTALVYATQRNATTQGVSAIMVPHLSPNSLLIIQVNMIS